MSGSCWSGSCRPNGGTSIGAKAHSYPGPRKEINGYRHRRREPTKPASTFYSSHYAKPPASCGGGGGSSQAMASSSTPAAVREMQKDLEVQANALSKIQKDIAKNHQVRKQYTIQVGENELVLKELELLSDGANVYKLIGPVLVKQDLAEAKANVKKRIEYISAELKRMDRALKDLEEKQNSKKESIFKLQQRMQAVQAKA
ncbi:prefoldin subunit 6-like [Miscanthus floridulus]|uniref:prefoldin subunit 6-like n=1 Tax=Miscanthus floridulus TaxID=154761 RepID=UPI003459A36D